MAADAYRTTIANNKNQEIDLITVAITDAIEAGELSVVIPYAISDKAKRSLEKRFYHVKRLFDEHDSVKISWPEPEKKTSPTIKKQNYDTYIAKLRGKLR